MRRSVSLALAVVLIWAVGAGIALVTEPSPQETGTANTTESTADSRMEEAALPQTTLVPANDTEAGPIGAVGSVGPDSSVAPASDLDEHDFHEDVGAEVLVPCDSDGLPTAPDDPVCLAQWVGFHIGVPSQERDAPLADYLTPQLAAQLSTFESTTNQQVGAVLLESAGQEVTVGPGEASVQLVIEKTSEQGQISLTILDVIVTLTPDGWRVATVDLVG